MINRIVIGCLIIVCICSCTGHRYEKDFVDKYEFEDFSLFKDASIMLRGIQYYDKSPILLVFIRTKLTADSLNSNTFRIILNKENYIIKEWSSVGDPKEMADTVRVQQMAQTFMKYRIHALSVDDKENVRIYIRNSEEFSLVRTKNTSEFRTLYPGKDTLINIRNNWYKVVKR